MIGVGFKKTLAAHPYQNYPQVYPPPPPPEIGNKKERFLSEKAYLATDLSRVL